MVVTVGLQGCYSWVELLVGFLPWQLAWPFLVPWSLVLREEAFRSDPAWGLWVLGSKYVVLLAIGTYHFREAANGNSL